MVGRWFLALIVVCLVVPADASQEQTVEWRLEHIAGVHPDLVRRFLADLKSNVRRDNRRAVCSSIVYPLKQEYQVRTAAECVQRYKEIFDQNVVNAITSQRFEDLFINSGGIMLGDKGQVWLSGICRDDDCKKPDLRLIAVNNDFERPRRAGYHLFTCRTDNQRIEVLADGAGGAIYRSWTRSRRTSTPPDLELRDGKESGEGSSGCAYSYWSFKNGDSIYLVSELGCVEGSKTPKDATGRFVIDADTPNEKASWCFD